MKIARYCLRVVVLGFMAVGLTACPGFPPSWTFLVTTKTSEAITTVGGKPASPRLSPSITGLDEVYSWNRWTERTLNTGPGDQLPPGALINLDWYPPQGSGGFAFNPPLPVNPQGPPPFRWEHLPPDSEVNFTYTSPGFEDRSHIVDEYVQASVGDDIVAAAKFSYLVHDDVLEPGKPGESVNRPAASRLTAELPWYVLLDVKPPVALTQFSCEYLQSAEAYFALRLPAAATTTTSSVPLPILLEPGLESQMQIYQVISGAPQAVVTDTLVMRPGSMGVLEQRLPQAPGQHWISLGASNLRACPASLDTTDWGISLSIILNGAIPAGQYPLYVCFAGSPDPSGGQASPVCSGPYDIPIREVMENPPPFKLSLFSNSVIRPPEQLKLPHRLNGGLSGGQSLTVTLANKAGLGGPSWEMYHDNEASLWEPTAPDMNRPIAPGEAVQVWGGPFNTFFWLVQPAPTAADTAPGQYNVVVTATQGLAAAGQPAWVETARNVIWVDPAEVDPPPPLSACRPVSGLTLEASHQRRQTGHTFEIKASVSPLTATLPVSYTYAVDALDPITIPYGDHSQAQSFTWTEPGVHTITVKASACGQANPVTRSIQATSQGALAPSYWLWLPVIQR